VNFRIVLQLNMFRDRLRGNPIGFSVLGIFIIEKNTILAVCTASTSHVCRTSASF